MIRIKLQDMMWRRQIQSIAELSRNAGVSKQTVDELYNRPDQVSGIQIETLDRLCRALSCNVEDLILLSRSKSKWLKKMTQIMPFLKNMQKNLLRH